MKKRLIAISMFLMLLINVFSITMSIIPTSASPAVIYVPDDYLTIQEAVGNASSGDTIIVAAGTYAGAIVDKNVTIIGGSGGVSIITSGVPYKVGSTLYTAFRLDSNADGAEVKNFTINCNSTARFYFAVFSRGADNVIVDSLTVNDAVQGITNWGGSDWDITNNVLNNTEAAGGGGIAIFLGVLPPTYTVCSGNLIQNNTITATAIAPDYTCPGIGLGVDLRYGAYDYLTGNEDMSNNLILNNGITAPGALSGVGIEMGVIGLGGNTTKIAATLGIIHDNTIQDNTIDGADMGVYFYTVANLTIQQNEIKNCNEGINIKDGSDGNIINYNNILDNTIGLNMSARAQVYNNTIEGGRSGIWLGPGPYSTSTTVKGNTIIDFVKAGIVTRGAKDIFIEGNNISTTLHDEAPNGIDIGTYSGTNGTVRENEISGCSWKDFTGDYETSWSGSGILVIESGDSLEIIGNTVHDCDVGMDMESDSMNITCNEVYDNIYGSVFWNAKPKVNYNNIYNNTQYGVYRTASGDLTGVLDARYNWWGDASGPTHPSNPGGTGDKISNDVDYCPWLLTKKVPPLVHDVAITKVVPSAVRVVVGTTIQVDVTAKNEGNTYETFDVSLYYDSNLIDTQSITDLTPGTTELLTFDWDTTGVTPCHDYTLTAVASTVPGETDTADNTRSAVDKVRIGPSAPLLKVEPAIYKAGRLNKTFTVNVTISNLSECWRVISLQFRLTYNSTLLECLNVTEGPFMEQAGDTFFIYYIEEDPLYGANTITGIMIIPNDAGQWNVFPNGSGTVATITFKTIYQERGLEKPPLSCALTLIETMMLDDEGVEIPHSVEQGYYEIQPNHIGDLNWDYKVDMKDVYLVAKAFGTYLNHPNWNPTADLNGDNKVDMRDIYLVARGFGWKPVDC